MMVQRRHADARDFRHAMIHQQQRHGVIPLLQPAQKVKCGITGFCMF
jgi:hypothetical protein